VPSVSVSPLDRVVSRQVLDAKNPTTKHEYEFYDPDLQRSLYAQFLAAHVRLQHRK